MSLWNNKDTASAKPKYVYPHTATAWGATTAYVVGDRVVNSSKIYRCITAGTSAGSGGPTTTNLDITDGTVHWQYIEATVPSWAATTAYVVGDKVIANGNLYVCATAGTSGSTSPSASGVHGIVDGTAAWNYGRKADSSELYFVDTTEAGIDTNIQKGFGHSGWNLHREYLTEDGRLKMKTETLVAMGTPASTSGDAEDVVVPDVSTFITITVQPESQSVADTDPVSFSVTATGTPAGGLTYQWQSTTPTGSKFTNISGEVADTLSFNAALADSGKKFRVVVYKAGAIQVTSDFATLTVA